MNNRVLLHSLLFLSAIFLSKTISIYFFILPLSIICLIAVSRIKDKYFNSIDMFWLLYQLSFVLVPAVKFEEFGGDFLYGMGVVINYPYGQIVYSQDKLFILFISLFLVALINLFIFPVNFKNKVERDYKIKLGLGWILILVYLSFLVDVYFKGGILNVLASRYDRDKEAINILSIFSTSLFFVLVWMAALKIKILSIVEKVIFSIILLIPLIIVVNPFNSARFFIIQAWLPMIFIFFPRLRDFNFYAFSLAFGMIVLMPILSLTTRHGVEAELDELDITPTAFLEFFDQPMVFLHLLELMELKGYQLGLSIISVIGFFIPRALWPDKPLVVGLDVGNDLYDRGYVGTSNLSGPIFLDFYYDFGILGVIFGSIILAYFFLKFIKIGNRIYNIPIFEYIVLSAIPILFRGSVGAVIGIVFFSLIFYYLFLRFFCVEINNNRDTIEFRK